MTDVCIKAGHSPSSFAETSDLVGSCTWCGLGPICSHRPVCTLLFRTGQEHTLRCQLVYAPPAVQPVFVVNKNAGFMFQRSLWSCVRFKVGLGMIDTT